MCLHNEKKVSNRQRITGYAVAEFMGDDCYNGIFYDDTLYEKSVKYKAETEFSPNSYYGFHGFSTLEDAKQYQMTLFGDGIGEECIIAILQCEFDGVIAYGTACGLPAFRSRYRTILKEVESTYVPD